MCSLSTLKNARLYPRFNTLLEKVSKLLHYMVTVTTNDSMVTLHYTNVTMVTRHYTNVNV